MRIAILTLPLHINYGGILQAYALQNILQSMGHEVFLYDTPFPGEHKLKKAPTRWDILRGRLFFWGKRNGSQPHFSIPKREVHIRRHITRFLYEHFNLCQLSVDQSDSNIEGIVVGSDQIWRPLYFPNISLAYLSFTSGWSNVRRVAYACSFGTDTPEYTPQQIAECGTLLTRFEAVSVREASMIAIMQEKFGWQCTPRFVLDPTMLLSADDWKNLCHRHPVAQTASDEGKKLFTYFLDPTPEKKEIAALTAQELSTSPYTTADLPPENDSEWSKKDYAPVESWLQAFAQASYVLTDSFHGCVFSILFNKPFAVVCNHERGAARFHSLLTLFKLTDRLLTRNNAESIRKLVRKPTNWEAVNQVLAEKRAESLAFLQKSLS